MKEKLDKIIELLDSTGPEPEYLEIKTPIKEDPEGWYVTIMWMHHDGAIELMEPARGQDLNDILEHVIVYLQKQKRALEIDYTLGETLE